MDLLAGFPNHTSSLGMAFVTMAPAPITQLVPIDNPGNTVAFAPITVLLPMLLSPQMTAPKDTWTKSPISESCPTTELLFMMQKRPIELFALTELSGKQTVPSFITAVLSITAVLCISCGNVDPISIYLFVIDLTDLVRSPIPNITLGFFPLYNFKNSDSSNIEVVDICFSLVFSM